MNTLLKHLLWMGLCAGCAQSSKNYHAPPTDVPTLSAPGFIARIPLGSTVWSEDQLEEVSAQTGQAVVGVVELPPWGDVHTPSIVVVVINADKVNPATDCAYAATSFESSGWKLVLPAELVRYNFGETCHFEIADDNQHTVETIVSKGDQHWMVACNMHPSQVTIFRPICHGFLRSFE